MKQLCAKALTYTQGKNSELFLILLCFLIFLGTGCTSLHPDFEKPSIGVTSFKPVISDSITPRFEIGMRVVNPNAISLNLRGMSYKIFFNDYEVVAGAANELPVVPAYGEAEFKVIANVGLLEGIRFVGKLMQSKPGPVAYRIQTKLDTGAMNPAIRINQTGSFSP